MVMDVVVRDDNEDEDMSEGEDAEDAVDVD